MPIIDDYVRDIFDDNIDRITKLMFETASNKAAGRLDVMRVEDEVRWSYYWTR